MGYVNVMGSKLLDCTKRKPPSWYCGVVFIGIREDTHVNIPPSPKGLVLEWSTNEAAGLVGLS
jgi:hypothetical protein